MVTCLAHGDQFANCFADKGTHIHSSLNAGIKQDSLTVTGHHTFVQFLGNICFSLYSLMKLTDPSRNKVIYLHAGPCFS